MDLKELRESREVTQLQAAVYVGVTIRSYQAWEYAQFDLPFGAIFPLAHLFQCEISDIVRAYAETWSIDAEGT